MKRMKITAVSLLSAALMLSGVACFGGGSGASSSDDSSVDSGVAVSALLAANDWDAVLAANTNVHASIKVSNNGVVVSETSNYYAKDEDGQWVYDVRGTASASTYQDGMIYHVSGDDYVVEFVNPSNYNKIAQDAFYAPLTNVSEDLTVVASGDELKISVSDSTWSLEVYFNATTNLLSKAVETKVVDGVSVTTEAVYNYSIDAGTLAGQSALEMHAANDPVAMYVNYVMADTEVEWVKQYTVSKDTTVEVEKGYGVYKNDIFTCDAEDFTYLYAEETEVVVYFTEKRAELSFEYTLTEEQYAEYNTALAAAQDALINEGAEEVINENLEIVFDYIEYFRYQYSIASCYYYLNMGKASLQ